MVLLLVLMFSRVSTQEFKNVLEQNSTWEVKISAVQCFVSTTETKER